MMSYENMVKVLWANDRNEGQSGTAPLEALRSTS